MAMFDTLTPHRRDARRLLLATTIALLVGLAAGWGAGHLQHGKAAGRPAKHRDIGLLDQIKIEIWKRFGTRGTIVMVGDSHTDLADWSAIFPGTHVVNRGVSGDTTAAVLARLDTILSVSATTAVVMIGTNDVLREVAPAEVEANYRAIIDRLRASGARVVVTSTPLTALASANARIAALNAAIAGYCRDERCRFVDLNASIARDGRLRPDMSVDGVHLNGAGYALWAEALAPHLGD